MYSSPSLKSLHATSWEMKRSTANKATITIAIFEPIFQIDMFGNTMDEKITGNIYTINAIYIYIYAGKQEVGTFLLIGPLHISSVFPTTKNRFILIKEYQRCYIINLF